MAGPRTIVPRGKMIIPEVVTRGVTRVVDRIIGKSALVLPILAGDVIPELPTVDTDLNDVTATDDSAGFLAPLKRFRDGFMLTDLPSLEFHGGKEIAPPATSLTDTIDYRPSSSSVTIDWSDFYGAPGDVLGRALIASLTPFGPPVIDSENLSEGIALLLSSVARNTTLDLNEVKIFLHSGRAKTFKTPPRDGEISIQTGEGHKSERLYVFDPDFRTLAVHLFKITERLLERYANGFIGQEMDRLYPSLIAQSLAVPIIRFFGNLLTWSTELYWRHQGSSILLYRDGIWSNIAGPTLPHIAGASFLVKFDNFTGAPSVNDRSIDHTRWDVSISIPADNRALLAAELGPNMGAKDYFENFARQIIAQFQNGLPPIDANIIRTTHKVGLSIFLTPSDANFSVAPISDRELSIAAHLPLGEVAFLSDPNPSSDQRIRVLLNLAIEASKPRIETEVE